MTPIVFDPYIPLALWVPLALAAAGLLTWYAVLSRARLPRVRHVAVVALMALAVALPLAILLNPTWQSRVPPPPGKPLLTVLVDRSASMATPDASDGQSRYAAACRLAADVAEQLGQRYEVRVRTFAEQSALASPKALVRAGPDGTSTDLAAAIDDALDQDRPQGQALLLLSDGAHNAPGGTARVLQSADKAKAMSAPVYAHTLGGQGGVRDLEVEVNVPEELAFVAQQVPVVATLHQRGTLAKQVGVALLLDGRTVERRPAELKPDGDAEVVFHLGQPAPGLYRYTIQADALPGEVTTLNNTAPLLLRVIDQPVRVLLLEGKPYWDTKFLVRTLSADASIELTAVVQLAEGRLWQRTISRVRAEQDPQSKPPPAGPAAANVRDQWTIQKEAGKMLGDPEALAPYQIVVLGRSAEAFLTGDAVARLRKWLVEKDGSLVCFRGSPSSQIGQQLGALMPVRWTPGRESRFRVRWTPTGQSLRWLPAAAGESGLEGLPSLAKVAQPERVSPLAVVLAASLPGDDGREEPVITYHPVSSTGRTVVVEGAGMWRWAFLPPQQQAHGEAYGLLWRSLIRWLVANAGLLPSRSLALRADKVTFSTTESTSATLLVREDRLAHGVPQVELTGDTLQAARLVAPLPAGSVPGQLRVVFGKLPEGRYRARVMGAGSDDPAALAAFDVRGNLKERLDVAAQPALMQAVARQSGGALLERIEPARLAEQFERQMLQSRPERVRRAMAWDRWWLMAGALLLWGVCWGLRRRSGLV